jgi:hypothetical protein
MTGAGQGERKRGDASDRDDGIDGGPRAFCLFGSRSFGPAIAARYVEHHALSPLSIAYGAPVSEYDILALLKEQRDETRRFLRLLRNEPSVRDALGLIRSGRALLDELEAMIERLEHRAG